MSTEFNFFDRNVEAVCETCCHQSAVHTLGTEIEFPHPHPNKHVCMIMGCLIIDGRQCGGLYYESQPQK